MVKHSFYKYQIYYNLITVQTNPYSLISPNKWWISSLKIYKSLMNTKLSVTSSFQRIEKIKARKNYKFLTWSIPKTTFSIWAGKDRARQVYAAATSRSLISFGVLAISAVYPIKPVRANIPEVLLLANMVIYYLNLRCLLSLIYKVRTATWSPQTSNSSPITR